MLSLFPPPAGPSLPQFSSLFVKGTYHPSAPFHLAIGHVFESPQNEVLILSPSRERLEQKLKSGLDEWLASSGTSNKARAAMSRIIILHAPSYPPSPAHFSLLLATLDGTQSASELTDLWAELPITPTENLSMIILDDISTYFEGMDQAELSLISLISRVMQSTNRVSKTPGRSNFISIAWFESDLFNPKATDQPFQRSVHMENAIMGLFQWVCRFEGMNALPAIQHDVPSSQDEQVSHLPGEKARSRKTVRTTSTQGDKDDHTCIEYIEVAEYCPDIIYPVLRFLW